MVLLKQNTNIAFMRFCMHANNLSSKAKLLIRGLCVFQKQWTHFIEIDISLEPLLQ